MKRNFVTLGLISLAIAACSGGENGIDGKDGKDGDSCTITNNEDGTATITCPDGSSFTIKNGENGHKGDAGSDGEKGQNGQSCKLVENIDGSLAVVCPADGSSYIVRGNTDNYKNYCKDGYWGLNCENKCPVCLNGGKCNDGPEGDGTCSCLDSWTDEDCSVCPAGFYDGVTDCFDCRKGSAYFGSEKCKLSDTRAGETVTYNVVTIGNQTWMAENLKATKDINGNAVNCYANTDETNGGVSDFVEKYGCLYVWEELATLKGETNKENTNRICPSDWRLPKKDDFDNLLTYVDDNKTASSNFLALIKNSTAWTNYSKDGVDDFGFGALPASNYFSGNYYRFGLGGYFWSSTESNDSRAYSLGLGYGSADVDYYDETYGRSVRCLKDSN